MRQNIRYRTYLFNKTEEILVVSTIFLILLVSCNTSKAPKTADSINQSEKLSSISAEDREKLWPFIKNKERLPVLAIDSATAVDSLKVAPASYHLLKESFRWKKAYPVEDFLLLRSYVQTTERGQLVITIDSIRAVDSLKVNPQAYVDLRKNIQDCNEVLNR